MSNLDPDADSTVQTTLHPDGTQTRIVRASPSRAGYWIAGVVAVIAIIGVTFMVVSRNHADQASAADTNANQTAVSTAYQQGQTQAQIDAANQVAAANQTAANQAAAAQAAQNQAATTQAALAASTDAANRAALRAQRATDRTEQSQTVPVNPPPSGDAPSPQ
jgi:hypothetical protein